MKPDIGKLAASYFFLCMVTVLSAQYDKVALVIGVKTYTSQAPLANSLNDSRDMAAVLREKGFFVIESYDAATNWEMQTKCKDFIGLLKGKKDVTGVFFYSGHGIQVNGENFLVPANADPQTTADCYDQCLSLKGLMNDLDGAGNKMNVLIVDACRNNTLRSTLQSGAKGLAKVTSTKGSVILFSTGPNSTASDGTGRNGIFTAGLLKYIDVEGLELSEIFKLTARDVALATGDRQRPWMDRAYYGEFYFSPPKQRPVSVRADVLNTSGIQSEAVVVGAGLDYGYGTDGSLMFSTDAKKWFARNLSLDVFRNGDQIMEAQTNEEWLEAGKLKQPAWCYFNNDETASRKFGKLYNWYAVSDSRGLCPSGWHIPSDPEWSGLVNFFGGEQTAASRMRGQIPDESQAVARKEPGFSGVPAGYRGPTGKFADSGRAGYWWSSSAYDGISSWYRIISIGSDGVERLYFNQAAGYSVRCVED